MPTTIPTTHSTGRTGVSYQRPIRWRRWSVLAVVVVLIMAGSGYLVAKWSNFSLPFVSDTCRIYSNDTSVKMKPTQLSYAATIAAVGIQMGFDNAGIAVAIATAYQESKIHNLSGGDRDSVGLFQQRPSQGWGTPEQLQNPRYASEKFYERLETIPDWQNMRITDAAQAVQKSAHPEAYQKWESNARTAAAGLYGSQASAVTCKLRETGGMSGTEAANTLTQEFALDHNPSSVTPQNGNPLTLTTSLASSSASQMRGWQIAHWFVAKSREYGVQTVEFNGSRWTAKSGKWSQSSGSDTQVVISLAD